MAEELFGMIRRLTGDLESDYCLEKENRQFDSDITLSQEMRRQLLSVSSPGRNTAAKGFMGKLRVLIGSVMFPKEGDPSLLSLGLMNMGSPGGYRVGTSSYNWSLKQYKSKVESSRGDNAEAVTVYEYRKRTRCRMQNSTACPF